MNKFIKLAIEESKKSTDPSKGVGALLFCNETNEICGRGYNKFPTWFDIKNINNITKEVKGNIITHAEIDCLNHTKHAITQNPTYTMVITVLPCIHCTHSIINSVYNITKIVCLHNDLSEGFMQRYKINDSIKLLNKNNIDLEVIDGLFT